MRDVQDKRGSQSLGGSDANDALDELDTFLDDFEKRIDLSAATGADAAMMAAPEEESDNGDEYAIGEELDIGEGFGGEEVSGEEFVLEIRDAMGEVDLMHAPQIDESELLQAPEPHPVTTPSHHTAMQQEALSLPAREGTAPPPSSEPPSRAATPAPGQGMLYAAAAVALFGLLLGLGALWLALGLGTRIDELNQRVAGLQTRAGEAAGLAALAAEVSSVSARVDELAVIIEGPLSNLRDSSEGALAPLESPLVGPGEAPAPTASPLVVKAEPAAMKPSPGITAPAATVPAADGAWVVNLLSVTSLATAEQQMAKVKGEGIRADLQAVQQEGKTWYRLRVTGFSSYDGAKAYIATLQRRAGFEHAWVGRE